ncbi:MAG: N-acetylmuramoyl-L-alanine amidase [Bacillota bacterium]|jgi:N-acetylmuramoyl-L-alanine amidase/uncharacterized protein YgiM (DUF1202 family)
MAADPPKTVIPSFQGFRAKVVGDVCNLRTGPGTSYARTGQVSQGQWLDILGAKDGWYLVRYNNKETYIAGWLIDIDLESGGTDARITKTDVNVRENPSLDSRVKFITQKGSVYPAVAKRGEWVKVSLGDDTGWIREDLLQLEYRPVPGEPQKDGSLLVYPSGQSLTITQTAMQGSAAVAVLSRGESARLVSCQGGYILVETVHGVRGWVYGPMATISSTSDKDLSFRVSDAYWSLGKYATSTVTHTDVNFRSGPGTTYPVIASLQKGDVLRVIERSGEWIHAVSPRGVTGWVAGWLTGGINKPASPGFSVTLDAQGPTRILTVSGDFESAVLIPRPEQNALVVSTSIFFKTQAHLPVNAYEFASLEVKTSDVTIGLLDKANYRVVSNTPGKVVIEFAPLITSIDIKSQRDADVLTLNTVGYASPTVTKEGDSLDFFVPGASFVGPPVSSQGETVRCLGVLPRNGGTSVLLDTDSAPYFLRRSANVIEVRFPRGGLAGKTIVLDPGHETNDPGCIGPTGLAERNVNWEIAQATAEVLRNAGAVVYLTRGGLYEPSVPPKDYAPGSSEYSGSLAKRAAWSAKADLFISLHNDWNRDQSVSGTTSYITSRTLNGVESRRLASLLQKHLTMHLGTVDKGVREAEFYVTREAKCPAVLVEVMFLSNPHEESRLRQPDTWNSAALGILGAVQEYFASQKTSGSPPSGI